MATSPTQRTLKKMRGDGYVCQTVERWCSFSRRRIDLWSCIDVLCLHEDHGGVTGVQTTSASNLSKRKAKILGSEEMRLFIECGNRMFLHGWRKGGPKGKRKTWICNETQIRLCDFQELNNVPAMP